ncbi:MAG: VOC family protein, partial [Acidobacteriota bacterium]
AAQDAEAEEQIESVAPIMTQSSMNVFRRFSAEPEKMYAFYGDALGLKRSTSFALGGSAMVWYQVGNQVVKLTGVVPGREYRHGEIADATGVRLLTFFYSDQAELVERFKSLGLPGPEFQEIPESGQSRALVEDPDGQWVELAVIPDAEKSIYDRIEIGLVVSDIKSSREFYGGFVGLEPLPPVKDPILKTEKYTFRHGSTLISLRSFGKGLPADTGSGGIQYVVSNAKAVEALAKKRNITIDQPLNLLANTGLLSVWLGDPDDITNYFAQVGVRKKP